MKFGKTLAVAAMTLSAGIASTPASAQDRYLAEVVLVGQNFCPRGTLPADGKLLPIARNAALFSLLGTTYGGDGRTTFALPDLRGDAPAGMRYCVVTQGIYPSRS
ncbi:tail fiber protein [Qipengyuania sp. 1XM1-15A]|uniref:phage tail protein n=1 Tax=Qipengyuania xiamenensis TaxID=2867237 RepID=UPI001C87EF6F|nr:tail fiber protein [Qipengyuania xiamenensis]MBX7532070.1 tail fiber protein [Qipengyuania xiamenensis]